MNDKLALYERYKKYLCACPAVGLLLDISRMRFDEAWLTSMAEPMARAFRAMDALEQGAIANPDENRMVGHYWLRAPERAPSADLRDAIVTMQKAVLRFAADVHEGRVTPERVPRFQNLLVIGIGGSALGPELAASALTSTADRMRPFFFDNTDPDGMARTLAAIGDGLAATLTVVISKSGGTKETRNGMLYAARAYEKAGLSFARHAVAVTGQGSELDAFAKERGFVATFPMWDWVGGRTSEMSAVGLLPAALQGIDIHALLDGARDMDEATRLHDARKNPAALLALMWHFAGDGRGKKDMVVLPYKDRLELFSRYLQQLVMESLGKERDRAGRVVHQGIAVYGNKGSTDQHAYVQQLRDGVPNFFATFIEIVQDESAASGGASEPLYVDPGVTSGDYLSGFLLGTRRALYDNGRDSVTLTFPDASARTLGALIALYERAVGLYAELVDINAYNQPGVEAGKKAAGAVIALQGKLVSAIRKADRPLGVEALAQAAGAPDEVETVFKVMEHLAQNPGRAITKVGGSSPDDATYRAS